MGIHVHQPLTSWFPVKFHSHMWLQDWTGDVLVEFVGWEPRLLLCPRGSQISEEKKRGDMFQL